LRQSAREILQEQEREEANKKAIRIYEHGGPEILLITDIATPEPSSKEVLVRNEAIGVNFIDTQHRAGLYYSVDLPLILGVEAAGVVAAIGLEVSEFAVGDRVGYAGYMGGVYSEYTVVPEARLVPVPSTVNATMAAASLLQGMTAHFLAHEAYAVREGDTVLIHAAAGGVGLLLVQMTKRCVAIVIGTVSSVEKAQVAHEAGADHLIISTQMDFATETMRLTDGRGVHVVYDSVGRTTFDNSLNVLRARGSMVVFGLSSGPIPPFGMNHLSGITGSGNNGSLFFTFATLNDYASRRQDFLRLARDVLYWIAGGVTVGSSCRHVSTDASSCSASTAGKPSSSWKARAFAVTENGERVARIKCFLGQNEKLPLISKRQPPGFNNSPTISTRTAKQMIDRNHR
jgi:NADPH2:quinone reductase